MYCLHIISTLGQSIAHRQMLIFSQGSYPIHSKTHNVTINFQCTISVNQNALRSNSVHFELCWYFFLGPWKHSFWNSRWNSETCLSNIGQILWAGNYQFGKPEKDRWTTKWSPDIETGEWLQDLRPPWGNSAVTEAFSSKTGSKPSLWWHLSICGWAVS